MTFDNIPFRVPSLALIFAATLVVLPGWASGQKTTRILGPGGVEPDGHMNSPFVSQDGTSVVFTSGATNLVPSDMNGALNDAFHYDVASQTIELISKSTAGVQSDGLCSGAICSSDGERIVFWSFATNLDPLDSSPDRDVFLHDRSAGTTVLVSDGPEGFDSWEPYISPNGEWIVFLAQGAIDGSDLNGVVDVYRYEVATGDLLLVSLTNSGAFGTVGCTGPVSISNSGERVVFESTGALVNPDGNNANDLFVRDLATSQTLRVAAASEPSLGASEGHISANGQFITFTSASSNFVQTDTNMAADVFVWGLATNNFSIVSRAAGGIEANGSSSGSRISRFGRYVVFASNASNLAPDINGLRDMFWYDRQTKALALISSATDGTQGNSAVSGIPNVSQDGSRVAYQGSATNLVPGDTTSGFESFLGWRFPDALVFCTAKVNSLGCVPQIAATGSASAAQPEAFDITASNVLNNKNGLFFYGLNGATVLPFQGGTLCVFPPLKRTTIMNSLGAVGPSDCSGSYTFDFNSWLQGGSDANLSVGLEINGQFWSRDPVSTFGVGLTDGVRFVICP